MRALTTPGRAERSRVAHRVRVILADARPADEAAGAAADDAEGIGGADLGRSPWLPDDGFAAHVAHGSGPVPVRTPAPGDFDSSPRDPGPIARWTSRLPVRVDPGRRGAIAVGVAVLVAAVVTGVWVMSARPHAIAVTGSTAHPSALTPAPSSSSSGYLTPGPTPGPTSAAPSTPAAVLVVDVAGKVRHPGLYRLPTGSRIYDAVQAAGGALPGVDLSSLNLAAKVADGQQIAVGAPGAAVPVGGSAGGGAGSSTPGGASAPVDLNSATLEQLETLPGVGPVLGQHILDWRAAHGSFATIDQLREVSGIGDVKFAALRSQVTV